MKSYRGVSSSVAAFAVAACVTFSASGATLTLGGQADTTGGRGMISAHPGLTNVVNFGSDPATCAKTSPTTTNGTMPGQYQIGAGSITNVRRAPDGDTQCYASVGYGLEQLGFFGSTNLTYFGFYWGSVDSYNAFQILGPSGPLTIHAGSFTGTTVTGADLFAQFGLSNTGGVAPSVYVDIAFDTNERANSYLFASKTNTAFEFDNIAASIVGNPTLPPAGAFARASGRPSGIVPEPATLGLLGLSVLALAARKRARG